MASWTFNAENEHKSDFRLTKCELSLLKTYSNLVILNENEFMVASDELLGDTIEGIYIYNIKHNKWKLLLIYPPALKVSEPTITYDKKSDTIYLFCSSDKLVKINMNDRLFDLNIILRHSPIDFCYGLSIINDRCHIFSGTSPDNINIQYNHRDAPKGNQHFLWYDEDEPTQEMYEFAKLTQQCAHYGMINVPSQNKLYVIGGHDVMTQESVDTISVFNTINYTWFELEYIKLPKAMFGFGCILSSMKDIVF